VNPVIAALAQYGFLVSFALAAVVWLRLPRGSKWELLAIGIVGSLLCLAFIKVGGALYYHPRPFVTSHVEPLFPHVADNGFPSDHTVLTMFVALCVLYYSRRWGLVLVAVSLVAAVARVLAHVHSPLDIAGAVTMAALAAVLAHAIVTRLARYVRRPVRPGRGAPG
jgi:undecaprenyl-diphosphatase